MADPEDGTVAPWFSDDEPGTAWTWAFEGADGLRRLGGLAQYSAPDPAAFRARLVRVQLDHVALEAFRATPHDYERGPDMVTESALDTLTFVVLVEGTIRLTTDAGGFDVPTGRAVLVDSRRPVGYRASRDVRMLRAMVGVEHVPAAMRRRGVGLAEPLPRTALIDAFIAFVSHVLRSAASGADVGGPYMTRAVADLQTGLLAEAQEMLGDGGQGAGLRDRIGEHIERHLADPELRPGTIAEALGISLRHAHGTFNEDGRTISRFIRERRIDAVATELRSGRQQPTDQSLADRYGFATVSALRHAFRDTHGMSLRDYHRRGHRDFR